MATQKPVRKNTKQPRGHVNPPKLPGNPPPPVVEALAPIAAPEPAKARTYNNPSVGVRLNAEDRAVIVREQEAMVAEFPHLRPVLELATTLRMLALEGAAARLRAREAKAGK